MTGPDQQPRALSAAALACVFILALALSAFKVFNYDLFWHLKSGEWIAAHHAVPATDMFSFTRQGMEWIDAQWLFQLLLYGFYSAFGGAGATILQVLFTVAALGLLMLAVPDKTPVAVRALLGVLFLLSLNPRIECRPEDLSCVYMAAMFLCLERARVGARRWLVPAVIVQVLFVNSEGLWPIGLALAGAYAADAGWDLVREKSLTRRWRELYPWALTLAAMAAAGLLQPYGLRGALFPFTLAQEAALGSTVHKKLISDLMPIVVSGWPERILVPFCVLCVLALAAVVLSGKRARPGMAMFALIMAYLSFTARRNISVGSVALFQALSVHLALFAGERPWFRSAATLRWSALLAILAAAFFTLLTVAAPERQWDLSGRRPGFGIELNRYPVQSADYLKSISYHGNVINGENIGGYLIWALWPDCKVFADPRMEVGGEKAILFYLEIYNRPDELASLSDHFEARAVVITYRTPYTEFFQRMAADPRWALVHLDWNAAVFLRRATGWDRVIARDEIKDPLHYEVSPPP